MKLKIVGLGIAVLAALPYQAMYCAVRSVGAGVSVAAAVAVPVVVAQAASADDAKIEADVAAALAGLMHPLADAYYNGTFEELAKIIKASTDINADIEATRDRGETILDVAIAAKRWNVLEMFLDKGAIVDVKKIVFDVANGGAWNIVLHLVKASKINVNAMRENDYFNELGKKLSLTYIKKEDKTLLMIACKQGSISAVKDLIEKHNAHVDLRDYEGNTALFYAANSLNLELVRYLVEQARADINWRNQKGDSILHYMCSSWMCSSWLLRENSAWGCMAKYFIERGITGIDFNDSREYILQKVYVVYLAETKQWDSLRSLINKQDYKHLNPDSDCTTSFTPAVVHAARDGQWDIVIDFARSHAAYGMEIVMELAACAGEVKVLEKIMCYLGPVDRNRGSFTFAIRERQCLKKARAVVAAKKAKKVNRAIRNYLIHSAL